MKQEFLNNDLLSSSAQLYEAYVDHNQPDWIIDHSYQNFFDSSVEASEGVKYLLLDYQYCLENIQLESYRMIAKQATSMKAVETCSKILLDFNPQDEFIKVHSISVFRNLKKN